MTQQHLTLRDAASSAIALITYLDAATPEEWDKFCDETIEEVGAEVLISTLVGIAAGLADVVADGDKEVLLQEFGAVVATIPAVPLTVEDED